MRVLHICNDYCGSRVHANLYIVLDKMGVEQTVYTYFRGSSLTGRNQFAATGTSFLYRPVLNLAHRVLYHKKIRDVYRDLRTSLDGVAFDISHATTLFSDGALAYQLYQDRGIPYVVAVRSTDIYAFLRYAPWAWHNAKNVLLNAEKIVFITPAIKKKFCNHPYIRRFLKEIEPKFEMRPNGVDDYWLEHLDLDACRDEANREILYVGTFLKRKNAGRLIQAVLRLRTRIPNVKLHFVGSSGKYEKMVRHYSGQYPDSFQYHGRLSDKDLLRTIYRQCSVFALPSRHETFGLVYIEALSQGEKVLYAKNDGVDGLIPAECGRAVHPRSVKEIEQALYDMLTAPAKYTPPTQEWLDCFNWEQIGGHYYQTYRDILHK